MIDLASNKLIVGGLNLLLGGFDGSLDGGLEALQDGQPLGLKGLNKIGLGGVTALSTLGASSEESTLVFLQFFDSLLEDGSLVSVVEGHGRFVKPVVHDIGELGSLGIPVAIIKEISIGQLGSDESVLISVKVSSVVNTVLVLSEVLIVLLFFVDQGLSSWLNHWRIVRIDKGWRHGSVGGGKGKGSECGKSHGNSLF